MRYPGQTYDSETGLFYNWNRYYDPGTGRYITGDPMGLAGGLNTYAYVLDNPLGWSDPNGEDLRLLCRAGILAGCLLGGSRNGMEHHWHMRPVWPPVIDVKPQPDQPSGPDQEDGGNTSGGSSGGSGNSGGCSDGADNGGNSGGGSGGGGNSNSSMCHGPGCMEHEYLGTVQENGLLYDLYLTCGGSLTYVLILGAM